MRIVVIGSGYVGTTTAALLAYTGNKVVALDIDAKKVAIINQGKAPFYEAGLTELIAHCISAGNLRADTDDNCITEADVIFSCVGTPDNADGSPNMTYVNTVADNVKKKAKKEAIFVQKSTVPVGTGERLSALLADQFYVSNPEFLREGTAIEDSVYFDRIVLGSNDDKAAQTVGALFKELRNDPERILEVSNLSKNKNQNLQPDGEIITTGINSAELIKVTANAFLALKISFANSVAKLADKSGADVVEVMNGIGSDKRIGRAFLNAGRGYGGGCFPKDVSGLINVAIDYGVDFNIMTAATELNASMPGYIVNKVAEKTNLRGKTVAVLGLSFKAGTSDARKSPSVDIANKLVREGAIVKAYDPQANEEARHDLLNEVGLFDSREEAVMNADIVFIATDWQEFLEMPLEKLKINMSGKLVVDCMNRLSIDDVKEAGLEYIGVGR